MDNKRQPEKIFEKLLWSSRFIIILPVVLGLVGAVLLFIVGSLEIFNTITVAFPYEYDSYSFNKILVGILSAIDMYLIGLVLILFSFGVYELFISKIDVARQQKDIHILDIGSLDELKNKILKVIVMVLIVSFFKTILNLPYETPLEILYYALAIVSISASVYLIRKRDHESEV